MPIQSFKDSRCALILARTNPGKGFPADLVKATQRRLISLDAAESLAELGRVAGHHLEALKHDRAGQRSVRVNDQFRICVAWTDKGPTNVEFVDYHWRDPPCPPRTSRPSIPLNT